MIFKKLNLSEIILAIITSIIIFLFYFIFNFNYLTKWIDERRDSRTYYNYDLSYYEFNEELKELYPEGFERENLPDNLKYRLLFERFNLVNPHHIAFDCSGLLFYKILKFFGYNQEYIKEKYLSINYFPHEIMAAFQLRNLFIGSIGLALLFFLFFCISRKYILSLLITGFIGFSCGYWIYSQINDTPIIHSVMVAILFFLTINFSQVRKKLLYSLFLGIFHAVNVFFHQSDLIFGIVISFVLMTYNIFPCKKEENSEIGKIDFIDRKNLFQSNVKQFNIKNLKYLLSYVLSLGTIVLIIYFYTGIGFIGLTLDENKAQNIGKFNNKPTYFFNWLVLYSSIKSAGWGTGLDKNPLPKVTEGISTYFYESDLYNNDESVKRDLKNFFNSASFLPNLIMIFVFSVFLFSVFFSFFLFKKYGYVFLANIIFMVIYFVFASWWEPDYREFWVAPMFSFWIMAFLVINFLLEKLKIIKPVSSLMIYSFMGIIVFLLFYVNFTGFLYPYAGAQFRSFDIIKNKNEIIIHKKNSE